MKYLGKQNIAFNSHRNGSTLENKSVNHGGKGTDYIDSTVRCNLKKSLKPYLLRITGFLN